MHAVGTLTLNGERYDVDCYAVRDRSWRQIRKDTGLDWVTPHTFRKTVATLISQRVDAETASQQLGHSSPATTARYDRRPERTRREAVDRLTLPPARPLA